MSTRLTYYQIKTLATLPGTNRRKGLRTIGIAIRISEQNGEQTETEKGSELEKNYWRVRLVGWLSAPPRLPGR